MTGQVDVDFDEGETFYHVIEPGQQTIYNMTMNNSTPGPKDLVADTYGLNISGVPMNWTATCTSPPTTRASSRTRPSSGRWRGHSILHASAGAVHLPGQRRRTRRNSGTAQSYKDPAIQNDLITLTLMDVVHGINLDTSHNG